MPNPNVVSWTSLMAGYVDNGQPSTALFLFGEMLRSPVVPNDFTFATAIKACSILSNLRHGEMFHAHVEIFGYGARVGELDKAFDLAKSMDVAPDDKALLWGALLSASRCHGRVDIAAEACQQLVNSNRQVAGAYVTLSNVYASAGDMEKAHKLRVEMKRTGVHKEPGCSWIEIKDSSYIFYAGEITSCPRGDEVLCLLRELDQKMKDRGYVRGRKGLVFVDIEEEAEEEKVWLHSERLALGFGLISIPKGLTIRIMKNLRMCSDCHEAFKLISEIMEREFVVRDINRFHHFKNGCCTCNGFW